MTALVALATAAAAPAAAAHASVTETPQIVGGQPASQGQWPSVAYITINTGSGIDWCSGTVVAPSVVLTAGHCVVDETSLYLWPVSDYQVTTGSVTLGQGQTSAVTQAQLYPDWRVYTNGSGGQNADGDVALLQLATPTSVPSMPLATSADTSLYDAGTETGMAGWGMTVSGDGFPPDTLQYGDTVVQTGSYCADWAGELGAEFNAADQICTIEAPYDSESTCQGDSGGPLVADNNGTAVEIGVTSWSSATCNTTVPDYFANVASLSGWLIPEIQDLSPPTVTTGAATSITQTTAKLAGTIGSIPTTTTTFHFDYGTTTAYGQSSGSGSSSGAATVNATTSLTGLEPGTTYHYRLVATNANGTTYGADNTFTTAAAPPPPPPATPAAPKRPEAGTYHGKTSQHQPITLTVGASKTRIPKLKFGFGVRCSRHHGRLWYTLNAHNGSAFPLPIRSGLRLSSVFWDASDDRYDFTGTFTTTGTVTGTFIVGYRDAADGRCRSGLIHWRATT